MKIIYLCIFFRCNEEEQRENIWLRYRWALETSNSHEVRTVAWEWFLCDFQIAVTFVDADRAEPASYGVEICNKQGLIVGSND